MDDFPDITDDNEPVLPVQDHTENLAQFCEQDQP
jgi:hypothetical protein